MQKQFEKAAAGILSPFTIKGTSLYNSQQVTVPVGCYGWLAINKSDATVWVNEIPLLGRLAAGQSGESFGFMDNGRFYAGQIRVVFDAAVTDPLVSLILISTP